jgi:hypothetical protein
VVGNPTGHYKYFIDHYPVKRQWTNEHPGTFGQPSSRRGVLSPGDVE